MVHSAVLMEQAAHVKMGTINQARNAKLAHNFASHALLQAALQLDAWITPH
jgi:hypothetical protein